MAVAQVGALADLQKSLEELKTQIEETVLWPRTPIPVNDSILKAIRSVYPKLEAALIELAGPGLL